MNSKVKSFFSTCCIFLISLIVLSFARLISKGNPYLYIVFPIIWFLLLFFIIIKTKGDLLLRDWKLFKSKKITNVLLSILTLVLVYLAIMVTHPIFNQFIPSKPITSYAFSTKSIIGLLFSVLAGANNIMVAFVEEVTYRHEGMYVFKSNKLLLILMLIVSSILFGFSHYYNFNGSFLASGPYVVAGAILGISYLISNNIWVPIVAHILFNSTDIIASITLLLLTIFK